MHIVAIHHLQGPVEQLARSLGEALGIIPYEARSRVVAPGGGPAVVGVFAEPTAADACVRRLEQAGFSPLLLDSMEAGRNDPRFAAYQLVFGNDALTAFARNGNSLQFPYAGVAMLLRGTSFGTTVTDEVSREKKFSPGRAILSGGLIMTKTVKSVTQTVSREARPFLSLIASDGSRLDIDPEQMDFSTLGANLQLTRETNFTWICAELRRRCPGAVWDDRLQTRQGQAQLLGPLLSPEIYLDLAITLLVRSASPLSTTSDAY